MEKIRSAHMRSQGFTLTELMIAVAIFSIVSGVIYAAYQHQQNSYITQEQVADMQQNIRSALFLLAQDIKMAGFDPSEKATAVTNINNIARVAEFRFARDENGDGVIQNNEHVRYALTNDGNNEINDTARDGIANGFPCGLGRQTGIPPDTGGLDPAADNVEAVEFYYHLAGGSASFSPASPADIRSVDVSLLIRTGNQIKGFKNTAVYFPASNPNHETGEGKKLWGPFNDNYQRRLLVTCIKCRNLAVN